MAAQIKPLYDISALPAQAQLELLADVTAWFNAKAKLAAAQEDELNARKPIAERWFKAGIEGTNKITLPYGKELQATKTINRSVDNEQLDAAIASGTVTTAQVAELIKYSPDLKVADWKKANAELRKLFADIVTEKPGSTQVKIHTPAPKGV